VSDWTVESDPNWLLSLNANSPKGHVSWQATVFCGWRDHWSYLDGTTARRVAEGAKRCGWKLTKAHGWLCPACLKAGRDKLTRLEASL
jgi:hypothetical protein